MSKWYVGTNHELLTVEVEGVGVAPIEIDVPETVNDKDAGELFMYIKSKCDALGLVPDVDYDDFYSADGYSLFDNSYLVPATGKSVFVKENEDPWDKIIDIIPEGIEKGVF